MVSGSEETKPLFWLGNSQKSVRGFPDEVREVMGYGLFLAQKGGKHPDAKPLKGFGGQVRSVACLIRGNIEQPQRGIIDQPRATPWELVTHECASPERAE